MNHTYIIGEIGQNHNGSVDLAKLIIDMVQQPIHEDLFDLELPGIDAVKLTKRDLDQELSASQMAMPYTGPNAFASTYGEHRKVLELSDEEHHEVFKYTKAAGLDFVETLCAPGAMSLLKLFTPDRLKVASRDLTNLPLLEAMAETQIPIILSTGMGGVKELDEALEVISKHHSEIAILHCISQYPTHPDNVNLGTITYLKKHYPDHTIGFSDHTIGIVAPPAAVAMGAQIIEKHITIDRRMKGTDQQGSLGPDGVHRMVRDIRLIERSIGEEKMDVVKDVASAKHKLERSVASKRDLPEGTVITEEDIHLLSPGDGLKWSERFKIVGSRTSSDIPKNEIIYPNLVE